MGRRILFGECSQANTFRMYNKQSVVHTENDHEIRFISFCKATKRESQVYFNAVQN